jgi:YidC/Oxa1 family membrane protein insertase
MDKKNTIIGVLVLAVAFGLMFFQQKNAPAPAPAAPAVTSATATPIPAAVSPSTPATPNRLFATPAAQPDKPEVVVLTNPEVEVAFTDFGGAISNVTFRKFPAELGRPAPYVFNAVHAEPILAIAGVPGLDSATRWQLVEKAADHATYRAVADGRLEVTRTFSLPQPGQPGDPYRLHVSTTLRNLSSSAIGAQRLPLNLGTATLVSAQDIGQFLNAGYWNGDDTTFVDRSKLAGGSGFLGIGASSPQSSIEKPGKVVWAAVKNQFFASIFTPDLPGAGIVVRRVKVATEKPDLDMQAFGITADVNLDLPRIEAGATFVLTGNLYVGPKEYSRLKGFAQREDGVMEFSNGFTKIFLAGVFAPVLLTILSWIHGFIGNWGWAIILTTILLKTATLPLTLSAARSAKKMAKIQPRLKEINEKYADNPQKKQKATLELFQEAKVNPVGGCLPILITMPFFFGFYAMLQTSSDLRFADFLWVKDLASADTIAHIYGFPVNIMPLLMGITSLIQMQMMPTPATDNGQAAMMKFMPLIFVAFCYNFGSGLALYWTVSNLYTIGQQLVINRMKDPEPEAPASAAGPKNVTPADKRPKKK